MDPKTLACVDRNIGVSDRGPRRGDGDDEVEERTIELIRGSFTPLDALRAALRLPEHLLRADGSPRRVVGTALVALRGWHEGVPGWTGLRERPGHVMLVTCGACGYPDNAVDSELYLRGGGWRPCHRCGAVLTRSCTLV